MKLLKDSWVVLVAVAIFAILAIQNVGKAVASKPTMTTYPPVVAPLSWDMIKKECKAKEKTGKKLPKHCYKFV